MRNLCLSLSLAFGLSWGVAYAEAPPAHPNLLVFLVDDMGWQDTSLPFDYDRDGTPRRSYFNQLYRTPNMERLAAGGMQFTNAYASPVCSPTRTTLMTGVKAERLRITNWLHPLTPRDTNQSAVPSLRAPFWRMDGLRRSDVTLPSLLCRAGFRTMMVGKAHFGPNSEFAGDPRRIGFELNVAGHGAGAPGSYLGSDNYGNTRHPMWSVPGLEAYHGSETYLTEALTHEMIKAIELSVAEDKPFFAYMAHYAVHAPWRNMADVRFAANYPGLSGDPLTFATQLEGMDRSLGDLLDALERLGIAGNTFVVFLSDNGGDSPNIAIEDPSRRQGNAPLRGKKGQGYEGGIRVPMIAGWAKPEPDNPFQERAKVVVGGRCDAMVSVEDVFPTLLAVAGVASSHPVDGYDLGPYLAGRPGVHRPQRVVFHFPHDHADQYYSVIRDGRWKALYHYATGTWEFFDLQEDLGEHHDLAGDPAHFDQLLSLAGTLQTELERLGAQWPRLASGGSPEVPLRLPGKP